MTQRHAHFRDKALKKASDLAGESATQAMHKENVTVHGITTPVLPQSTEL